MLALPMSDAGLSISYEQKFTLEMEKEATFVVREKDWARIRRRIDSIQQQRREFAAVGWACVGVAVSSVFGGISWQPAFQVLPAAQRPDFAWVWPAIIALGLAGVVVGAAMFWAAHLSKGSEGTSIREVLEDMDDIRRIPEP
jgi:hypothetical protein